MCISRSVHGSPFSPGHVSQWVKNCSHIASLDIEQDSEYLLTSDCHSSEHNSVSVVLQNTIETFLKE